MNEPTSDSMVFERGRFGAFAWPVPAHPSRSPVGLSAPTADPRQRGLELGRQRPVRAGDLILAESILANNSSSAPLA